MVHKYISLTSDLYAYLLRQRSERDPILAELVAETDALGPAARMQISPEQGAFMTLLTRAIGARNAIEVGTFTGYSSLAVVRGLPEDGKLLCCDLNEEWTGIARRFWKKAGVADKIELRIGPALETLRTLASGPQFDIAFVDADKVNYRAYYEEILQRLRENGLILFDNVLWRGAVADPENNAEETRALRDLNAFLAQDERVEVVILPVGDGLSIARKK